MAAARRLDGPDLDWQCGGFGGRGGVVSPADEHGRYDCLTAHAPAMSPNRPADTIGRRTNNEERAHINVVAFPRK